MYGRYKVSRAVRRYVQAALDSAIEDKQLIWSLPGSLPSFPNASGTAWTELSLAQIAQGDTSITRTGKAIRIKSLEIKGVLASGASETVADDPWNVVRIIIATWRSASSVPCAAASLTLHEPLNIQQQQNLSKKYYDQYITLPITSSEKGGGDGYAAGIKHFRYYKRWRNGLPIYFADETTAAPSKLLVISCTSDSGAVPHPGFVAGYIKLLFEDA